MRIKHYLVKWNKEDRYACNRACGITKDKSTRNIKKVTCLNCLDYIKRKNAKLNPKQTEK